jgi:hypothetical protein
LEIAKKLLKFYYKLKLKLLKYELGAILGSFIFYLLSIVLDISGVEPFVINNITTPEFSFNEFFELLIWGKNFFF